MKKISELGISPWPWKVERITRQREAVIKGIDNTIVATMHADNARLIAAAPELYERLREAVDESCHECEDDMIENCRGKCFIAKWRDALAKAGGESEAKE